MINYALTNVTRVKARLGITTTSFDDMINTVIASTTAHIENVCGRRFKETTYTNELYDGQDQYGNKKKFLILKNSPVTTFTKLEYKTGSNSNPTWVELTEDYYDINLATGIVRIYSFLPKGIQNIRVTYTAGYKIDFDTADVYDATKHTLPYELSEICERVVTDLFKRRESEGKLQESFQESSISWKSVVFDDEIMRIIRNYKRSDII